MTRTNKDVSAGTAVSWLWTLIIIVIVIVIIVVLLHIVFAVLAIGPVAFAHECVLKANLLLPSSHNLVKAVLH